VVKAKDRLSFNLSTSKGKLSLQFDLSNTEVKEINDIDVEVFENKVTVSTSCGRQGQFCHPAIRDDATATFKKKKKQLILVFPFRE